MSQRKEKDERFNKFGTVSFTATTKVNDFIDYLEKGKVMATRCKSCGIVFFPPRADCYNCFSSDIEWLEISGRGKLVTYSKLNYAPVGFEGDLPYCIAVLDYGDFKIFGRISSDIPENEIKPGMEMRVTANRLPNGQLNYTFIK